MAMKRRSLTLLSSAVFGSFVFLVIGDVFADKTIFQTSGLGRNLGVWRLTNDPTVRDHANCLYRKGQADAEIPIRLCRRNQR